MRADKQPVTRVALRLGVASGCVMMLISWWMDGTGLRSGAEALSLRPLWIYTLCMLLAMVGVPAMCAGLLSWYRIVQSVHPRPWVRLLFAASALSYAVSSLYLVAIDCLPPIVYQTAVSIGVSPTSALAQNISVTLESCGWMLFMLVGIVHLQRSEEK